MPVRLEPLEPRYMLSAAIDAVLDSAEDLGYENASTLLNDTALPAWANANGWASGGTGPHGYADSLPGADDWGTNHPTIDNNGQTSVSGTSGHDDILVDGLELPPPDGNGDIIFSPIYAYGHDGNDHLWGSAPAINVYGGTGSDSLFFSDFGHVTERNTLSTAYLDGGTGDDFISGHDLLADYHGGEGDDYIWGIGLAGTTYRGLWQYPLPRTAYPHENTVDGGSGHDIISFDNAVIQGGDGNDYVQGNYVLNGEYGDDLIHLTGSNYDYGGVFQGDALIASGDEGRDLLLLDVSPVPLTDFDITATLDGGDGDDLLFNFTPYDGSGSRVQLLGGAGHDRIVDLFTIANSHIDGGEGNDQIDGGDGDDIIFGGDGNDIIFGGPGDDLIYGGGGNDIIYGGGGNDMIIGGDGDDIIFASNPELDGEYDTIVTGTGNDVVYTDSADWIYDYVAGTPPLPGYRPAAGSPGDYDGDDQLDTDDLDLVAAAFRDAENGGTPDLNFDTDDDGDVDEADFDFWITNIYGTLRGDANLDGQIDQADLDAVLQNWGTASAPDEPPVPWHLGNFDAGPQVEQGDLDQILQNWGATTSAGSNGSGGSGQSGAGENTPERDIEARVIPDRIRFTSELLDIYEKVIPNQAYLDAYLAAGHKIVVRPEDGLWDWRNPTGIHTTFRLDGNNDLKYEITVERELIRDPVATAYQIHKEILSVIGQENNAFVQLQQITGMDPAALHEARLAAFQDAVQLVEVIAETTLKGISFGLSPWAGIGFDVVVTIHDIALAETPVQAGVSLAAAVLPFATVRGVKIVANTLDGMPYRMLRNADGKTVIVAENGSGLGVIYRNRFDRIDGDEATHFRAAASNDGRSTVIFGKAQGGSDNSIEAIERKVDEMVRSGDYEMITMDTAFRTITRDDGTRLVTGQLSFDRPDIIGIRRDGTIDVYEVWSDGQVGNAGKQAGQRDGYGEVFEELIPEELRGELDFFDPEDILQP